MNAGLAPLPDINIPTGNQWFVIHTKPRQEFRALKQLENQHYHCFLPTLQKEKKLRGKIALCEEPLFSRYLFIQLNPFTSNWAPIRNTLGVSGLISFGGTPAPLPEHYIAALKNGPELPIKPLFSSGEAVTITEGSFAGLHGIYQMADGNTRAYVLLEFMNKLQRLNVPINVLRNNHDLNLERC